MANPISNWLYTGATPGTQAATQAAAKTTPWGQVGKQILAEGAFGIKGKPGGFGSVNVGFDPKYTGKGATNILGYLKGGAQSVLGMGAQGNIAGGTGAGRLAFEKLLQSPLARGVGTAGRLATGPIGAGITAAMTGAQLGDWAYKNWEPATKFGDWAGGGIYDAWDAIKNEFSGSAQAATPDDITRSMQTSFSNISPDIIKRMGVDNVKAMIANAKKKETQVPVAQKLANLDKVVQEPRPGFPHDSSVADFGYQIPAHKKGA